MLWGLVVNTNQACSLPKAQVTKLTRKVTGVGEGYGEGGLGVPYSHPLWRGPHAQVHNPRSNPYPCAHNGRYVKLAYVTASYGVLTQATTHHLTHPQLFNCCKEQLL